MATITIRLDEGMKQQASSIASYYGLDLSSVTRAFYAEMIRKRCVPLAITTPIPNKETLKEIEYGKGVLDEKIQAAFFTNAEDLLEAAGK